MSGRCAGCGRSTGSGSGEVIGAGRCVRGQDGRGDGHRGPCRLRPTGPGGGSDILCTVTSSPPLVLLGDWISPGTHVNAVGSSHAGPVEIDADLLLKGRYVVDSRRSAHVAAVKFLNAKDVGLVATTTSSPRSLRSCSDVSPVGVDEDEVTIYKSPGHIVQDLAAVRYLADREVGETEPNSDTTTAK